MFRPRRGGRQPSIATILLLTELFQAATTSGIPPVTLITIGLQILIFLRIIAVPWLDHYDVCLDVTHVIKHHQWIRLIASAFEHADDWHLYYNMISFLWKGKTLEQRFGPFKFLYMLIIFTLSCNATYIGLYYCLSRLTGDYQYNSVCAIGFSGVIFALKVLTTYYWPVHAYSSVYGIPVAARNAVWVELVFIQLVSPNASFIGHLSGILVGLAYVKGPLRAFIDLTYHVLTAPIGITDNHHGHREGPDPNQQNPNYNDYNRYYGDQASYENMRRRRAYNQPGFFGFNQGPGFFRAY
ncbi:rhomboid-related protein 4 [Tetranychus urticae]|uniref:Peptidase S54 rhomboid domain-containing protein n=1 Tax=Tetranychus urticae TaxID=32264 RepID=T1KSP7_TETUR|nr:rhomboid-related protein 4 [Tetranychus urticae]